MSCADVRKALTAGSSRSRDDRLADHLAGCDGCRSYAERLEAARGALRRHHAQLRPDAAFASRVAVRLPSREVDAMGLAALRLLPAGVLLALLLVAWILISAPATGVEETLPSDDLVTWLLETPDDAPRVSP